jgi:hypothetical protein
VRGQRNASDYKSSRLSSARSNTSLIDFMRLQLNWSISGFAGIWLERVYLVKGINVL